MQTCPRCGFAQPPDQFCANCGINMSTFVPPPPPLSQRLRWLPPVLIALIMLVVFVLWWRLEKQEKVREMEQVEEQEQSLRVVRHREKAPAPPMAVQPTASPSIEKRKQTVEQRPHARSSSANNHPVEILFYELQNELINELMSEEGNPIASNARYGAGIARNYEQKLALARNQSYIVRRKASGQFELTKNEPIVFFRGNREAGNGQTLGLTVHIRLQEVEANGGLKLLTEVAREMGDGNEPADFQEEAVVPPQAALFMVGIMPKRTFRSEEENRLLNDGLLSVFKSLDFKEGRTDVAVFIFPKSAAPQPQTLTPSVQDINQ